MSEVKPTPQQVANLEAEVRRRIEQRKAEKSQEDKTKHIAPTIKQDGVCLYCKNLVHRGESECSKCNNPIDEMCFQGVRVEHNTAYGNPLDNPEDNFTITSLSGGRITKIRNPGAFEG